MTITEIDRNRKGLYLSRRSILLIALSLAVASWIGLWYFYTRLDIEYPVSDPQWYWDGSTRLVQGFFENPEIIFESHHQGHLPGYPVLIALVRGVTGWNNPELMRLITLTGWTTNLLVIYRILVLFKIRFALRLSGTLLYGMFPLAGMSVAVHPISDTFALLCLSSGVLFFLRNRKLLMALALALALLTHKFTWPGVLIILAIGVWQKRISWYFAVLTLGPLIVYWLAISFYYNDLRYLISFSVDDVLVNARQFPVFDGVLQTLTAGLEGSFPDLVKGTATCAIVSSAFWLLVNKMWTSEPILLAFIFPILVFGLITTPNLVFALVRFGKLLVVPLLIFISQKPNLGRFVSPVMPFLVLLSLLSQFAFINYFTDFHN